MAAAIIVLVMVGLVSFVGINVYLRKWVQTESRAEAHLHDPRTHTVAYALPAGVDPAHIKYELSRSGFNAGIGRVGDAECLLIECESGQRDRVREIIRGAHLVGYDGVALEPGRVVFQDEL